MPRIAHEFTQGRSLSLAIIFSLFSATSLQAQTSQPASQPSSQLARPTGSRPAPTPPRNLQPAAKPTLIDKIAKAHNQTAWDQQHAISFTMDMAFGESMHLVMDITYDYHHNKVRMESTNGPTLVFDGETAWITPSDAAFPMARFHLLTWPYFFAAPFKLDDPGTSVVETGISQQLERPHLAARMTFNDGVGDSPDDWYLLLADPAGHLLKAMAYIVTYGGMDPELAEKECHAITYEEFGFYNGVVLAKKWTFFNWNEEQGIHGEPLGHASLSNIQFVDPEADLFNKPDDAREDSLPVVDH